MQTNLLHCHEHSYLLCLKWRSWCGLVRQPPWCWLILPGVGPVGWEICLYVYQRTRGLGLGICEVTSAAECRQSFSLRMIQLFHVVYVQTYYRRGSVNGPFPDLTCREGKHLKRVSRRVVFVILGLWVVHDRTGSVPGSWESLWHSPRSRKSARRWWVSEPWKRPKRFHSLVHSCS